MLSNRFLHWVKLCRTLELNLGFGLICCGYQLLFTIVPVIVALVCVHLPYFYRFKLVWKPSCVLKVRPWERSASTFDPNVCRCAHIVHHNLLRLKLLHFRGLYWTFKNIILKKALFDPAIWKLHPADTMLDAFLPLSLVARPVDPVHLTVAVPLVVFIVSLVHVSAFPVKLA